MALQAGEIDVCVNPPINELQYLEDDDNITVYEQTVPVFSTSHLT